MSMSAVISHAGSAKAPRGVLQDQCAAGPALGADPEDLRDLVRAVNETTQRLQATHSALHDQVARLQVELAAANAALRRSQQLAALGEMAAGIAHEVRNPLGSIQLYAQMLAEDLAGRSDQVELCAKIQRAVMGLDAVVRDVLSFARETTVRPEPSTADDLLDRALASCESLLAGIDVSRERNSPSLAVCADAGLIVQALGNVIRNAVEAMVEGGTRTPRLTLQAGRRRVRCSSGRQEPRIVFSIADTGPGIGPDVVERVFNPFFTTRKTGTGLGLAIVHRIVDAHGGHVHIKAPAGDSTHPTGTIVEMHLPIKPPAALTPPACQTFTGSKQHEQNPRRR